MSDLDLMSRRVSAAAELVRTTPAAGPGQLGAPDPETGERWNAGNVLGHLAEMLEFWTGQAREALAGASLLGRGEAGMGRRREGIEAGATLGEAELRERVERGVEGLLALLASMRPEDAEREVVHRSTSGERRLSLGQMVEELLVGHLEEHAAQLAGRG